MPARVRVILLASVPNLGKEGDTVNVSFAYARNFLLPKKLAQEATRTAQLNAESNRHNEHKKNEERLRLRRTLASRIATTRLTLALPANDKGKLYGSVQARDVLAALRANGIQEIRESQIRFPNRIDQIGEWKAEISLEGAEAPCTISISLHTSSHHPAKG